MAGDGVVVGALDVSGWIDPGRTSVELAPVWALEIIESGHNNAVSSSRSM
jgi:hypothetical protein